MPTAGRATTRWGAAWVPGVVVALLTLAGCAAPGLQGEARRNDAQLLELGRATDELRRELTGLRRELAELGSQLQTARGELLAAVREGESRQHAALAALDQGLGATERRVEGVADTVSGLETSVASLGDQVARLEAVAPPTPNGELDGRRERSESRSTSVPVLPEERFDRAMESFRGGELGQSVLEFEEFVGKHPSHPLVGSARFWIGEAYFRAREYQHAAVEYEKAVDVASNGDKTPEALLKLGLAHRALKREERARETWGRLLRDFPESEAAHKARTVLREMSRSGKSGLPGETR